MMTRAEKEALVSTLKSDIQNARAAFLTNLVGVPSNDANAIRKQVRDAKGKIVVTKNTFFRLAAKGTGLEGLLSDLKGNNAVAFAFEDAPGVAKALDKACGDFEIVELKGGILGDKELSAAEVKALASLPSKPEMLAGVLNTFKSPLMAFANCLQGLIQMKEENGDAPIKAVEASATTEEPTNKEEENKE